VESGMNYKSTFCQLEEYEIRQSPITGRALRVNGSQTKFLIDREKIHNGPAIAQEWAMALRSQETRLKHPNKAISTAIRAFGEITSVEDFMRKIDNLMAAGREWERSPGQKNHIYGWLLRLWGEGIIAVPREFPFATKTSLFPNTFMLKSCAWITDVQAAYRGEDKRSVVGPVFRVAGRTLGVVEPGDIVPETVALDHGDDVARTLSCMVLPLLVLQRSMYGDKATYNRASWSVGRPQRKVGVDRSFAWAVEKDETITDWQQAFATWLQEQRQGLALRTFMIDRALDYLVQNPALPRSVADYCRRHAQISPTWAEWASHKKWAESSVKNYTNYFADFFDWYLATALTDEDDFGRPVPSPAHDNPLTRQSSRNKQAETYREALPLRYIHELIRILTESDHTWPKSLKGDYFMWRDSATGAFSKIWSPVRCSAILVKLMLPLRTYQVRMLDSGEADSERFSDGAWPTNTGLLAPKGDRGKPVRRGFLRKFKDTVTGREFTGFFINTNKTADIGKDQRDRGYEIPWQHEDVIKIAVNLRAWQEKYNPISAPLAWSDIHDKTVLRSYTREMLRVRAPACFLFRDPCATYPAEPVLDSRLQIIWAQLLGELERRVEARGERLSNGETVKFVTPQQGGVGRANYDLHTLRVSLITAYATEGGVPIQILSKCIAGHATILMTLYYNKPGPAYVSEKLADAQEKMQNAETENFLRFLQNEQIRSASPLVVSNDGAGTSALDKSSPGTWVVGDLGICPVGGSLCYQGGPIQNTAASKPHYTPVPGGAKNCARCRFFITGPAFLGGLVARFNAVGVSLTAAAERLRNLEDAICQFEDGQFGGDERSGARELGLAYERRDRVLDEVDSIAHTWHALYWLIERCKAALRDPGGKQSKFSLVLAGGLADLRVALSECSDFELYNAVCQRAKVYPNENVLLANLRRGRLLDAMLVRSGRQPVFASLTESEALSVGNEFVELLMARAGRVDTNALADGRLLLDEIGITTDVERLLKTSAAKTLPLFEIKKKA
jgi:hypothetical protein